MTAKLAQLRKQLGLSQRELASAVGLSTSAIAMYEIGERTPSLDKAHKLPNYGSYNDRAFLPMMLT